MFVIVTGEILDNQDVLITRINYYRGVIIWMNESKMIRTTIFIIRSLMDPDDMTDEAVIAALEEVMEKKEIGKKFTEDEQPELSFEMAAKVEVAIKRTIKRLKDTIPKGYYPLWRVGSEPLPRGSFEINPEYKLELITLSNGEQFVEKWDRSNERWMRDKQVREGVPWSLLLKKMGEINAENEGQTTQDG